MPNATGSVFEGLFCPLLTSGILSVSDAPPFHSPMLTYALAGQSVQTNKGGLTSWLNYWLFWGLLICFGLVGLCLVGGLVLSWLVCGWWG